MFSTCILLEDEMTQIDLWIWNTQGATYSIAANRLLFDKERIRNQNSEGCKKIPIFFSFFCLNVIINLFKGSKKLDQLKLKFDEHDLSAKHSIINFKGECYYYTFFFCWIFYTFLGHVFKIIALLVIAFKKWLFSYYYKQN